MIYSLVLAMTAFAAPPTNRPITKVVNLLKDMQGTLEKEQKGDQELFDKLQCWCKTNDKEKTTAIAAAQTKIENLNSFIEESAAKIGALTEAIANLEAEIKKNQDSVATAQELRLKEQEAFQVEEKDITETIDALTKAIAIIGKNHGEGADDEAAATALLQVHTVLAPFKAIIQKDLWDFLGDEEQQYMDVGRSTQNKSFMEDVLSNVLDYNPQPKMKSNLLQQKVLAPTGAVAAKSYNSRSGEIFGVLKQMKDNFSSSLADARKEEKTAIASFQKLTSALTREINAATDAKNDKTTQLAETKQKNVQAKADLADTKKALSADEKFLLELQERCSNEDKAFTQRQKTRAAEITAVGETIGFLTDDEARDLFSRTYDFLQTRSSQEQVQRRSAVTMLMEIAKRTKSYHLAGLAISVKLDGFEKVHKSIDQMVSHLKKEQEEEYQHREWCNKELDTNEDNLADKNRQKEDLLSTQQDLTNTIATLTEQSKALNDEIAEFRTQLKRAGEDRSAQNKEFQSTVADQRATAQILRKAVARLRKFYQPTPETTTAPALFQNTPGRAKDNKAPPQQATYEAHGSSTGVLHLIDEIIADAERLEAEAQHDEQEAQKDYETIVNSTNASVKANQDELANKAVAKSEAELDLATTKQGLRGTLATLEKLTALNAQVHNSCDFVVKNFDITQKARAEEIESIQQAKAILSGAGA